MNAIGTQVRDPINSGLARWRIAVLVFKLSSKVNIWYYIAKSIRADIAKCTTRTEFVFSLNKYVHSSVKISFRNH